jgi:hypoxanthine phosphoribosyltransferase
MNEVHPDLERVLIAEDRIRDRVAEIAAQIARDQRQSGELCLLGILKGSFIFLADLARQLPVPHTVDFMALSSYGTTVTSGAVRIVMDMREPIAGKNVIIVEDIIDTGNTLSYLQQTLSSRGPASLRSCVLLRKERKALGVPIDYLGFEIPDVWVVGYGLDYAERFRTLPYIAELKPSVYRSP